MTTRNFQVTGMHCGGCARTVRGQVEQVPGVQILQIDAPTATLTIEVDPSVQDVDVVSAVERAGYEAVRS